MTDERRLRSVSAPLGPEVPDDGQPDIIQEMPPHLQARHLGKLSVAPEIIQSMPDTLKPSETYAGPVIDPKRGLRESFFATDPHDSPRKPR